MTSFDHRTDHRDSYYLCVMALRERGVRHGALTPLNDGERRQAKEGPRETAEFDCVRGGA